MFIVFVVVGPARIVDVIPMLGEESGFFILLALLPPTPLSLLALVEIIHIFIIRCGGDPIRECGFVCNGLQGRLRRGILRRVRVDKDGGGAAITDTSGDGTGVGRWRSKLVGDGFCLCLLRGNLGSFGGLKS